MSKLSNSAFFNKFNKDDRLAKNYISRTFFNTENRDDRRFFKCNISCSLCNAVITDARDSHNALPLSEDRCCEKCNYEKVLPARFMCLTADE